MNVSVDTRGVGVPDALRGAWPYAIGVVAACMLALCVIFRQEVAGALRVWTGSATYNHCYLIGPIVLYMIWQRRGTLLPMTPKPEFRALLLIPLLSLAWFAGSVFGILEARQFIVLTIVQLTLLGVLGWPIYRRLMAPFLYLYFLVPSGEFLVPALQDFTAQFAVLGLQLLGIPVFSDGIIISVPAGDFEVAEACAGLRFLIAAIAFGVFYATEIYESRTRRMIFIGLSIVVPIVANGFRALGLITAAEAFGSAAAIEADHVTYGWIFFSLVLIALIFIGRTFSDREWAPTARLSEPLPTGSAANRSALAFAGVLAIGLATVGPAVGAVLDASAREFVLPAAPPSVASPWQPAIDAGDWHPRVVTAGREFSGGFTMGQDRVDRFVAVYLHQGRINNLVRSENSIEGRDDWAVVSRNRSVAHIGGREVPVNAVELALGDRRKLVWWFYALDGATAASLWDVKRHTAQAYFTGNSCPSAMVAVGIDITDRAAAAATLDQYLSSMEPLAPYLCGKGTVATAG